VAKILLAWELGANLGHLGPLSLLGRELRTRGHEPVFVVRSLKYADELLGRHRLRYLQGPVWPIATESRSPALNYSEILQRAGFLDHSGVLCMVKAWRELFSLVAPDMIVLDHAPFALLAAHDTGIRRVLHGSGFGSPPREDPFPNMHPWLTVPEGYLKQSDDRVLASVNKALSLLNSRPLERFCDMFDVEEDLLCTFPELDHYPSRGTADYCGPAIAHDLGVEPQWRGNSHKRIFGYLHSSTSNLDTLLAQLSGRDHEYLWVIPNIASALKQRFEAPRFRFSDDLCKLDRVSQQCDIAITNAGHGTTAAFLLGGISLLLLPRYVEQHLMARNVNRLGAGLMLENVTSDSDYLRALDRLTDSEVYSTAAEAFAEKYSGFRPQQQLAMTAERIERILQS
jgi:UDP:flavonoid glycosyltransferase YjiC (YdhE family)